MNWNNIKQQRFNGLVEQIEYYLHIESLGKGFSNEQKKHIQEIQNTICVFGELGLSYSELCKEMLSN